MRSATTFFAFLLFCVFFKSVSAQALKIPNTTTNFKCSAGRTIGATDIFVKWNAPGVKGREGNIFGTDVAPFGMNVLGYGSDVASPWRAGADECTTMSFSTDVNINGQVLSAGQYAFFILLNENKCTLIFNKNVNEWGSYFYDGTLDVLRVEVAPQKDVAISKERLEYTFSNQTDHGVDIALEWEHWRIPFTVEVDITKTTLASIKSQMSGGMGFDPPSLIAAANWCLANNVNYEEAYRWINSATDPNLGGVANFRSLSTKAGLLTKMGKSMEADEIMDSAINSGSAIELHQYGRQLLGQKKIDEAMKVFKTNFEKNNGAWPTNVGMMRAYSAKGDFKKALEFAKKALPQAPDDVNKKSLELSIKTLESGKPL